jgi:ribosomal protein L11 methyltransferase
MPFQSLTLTLSQHDAEAFSDALMEEGAISVNVEDADEGTASEKPIFGEPGASTGMWQTCKLVALFAVDADVVALAQNAVSVLNLPLPQYEIDDVEDVDWVQQNRDQFQPIQISPRIWIVPTWHSAPSAHAINISLDPGAAFGTGSHPTTRLCLQWLEAHIVPNQKESMLDYGTGSGILAIAAIKLGAHCAMGVDIDAQAIETARYNAIQNNVTIDFATTDNALDYVADVTVANILSNPLKLLAPLLASHTKPGGCLALAGILDHQADEIIGIYAPYFDLQVWKREEGWSCIAGTRHRAMVDGKLAS